MQRSLLTTKIQPPLPSQRQVSRTRLHTVLEASSRVPLTIIVAPTGYGKTSLLTNWADRSKISIAWFNLDDSDNIKKTFLMYFVAALTRVDEDIKETKLAAMVSGETIDIELILITLLNYFSHLQRNIVLVLDNYNVIENEQIDDFLSKLLDQQNTKLHLVISTQSEPSLPIARLRAKQKLLEIRVQDLRFSQDETHELIKISANRLIVPEQVKELTRRTEGWIAGLQLALIALEMGNNTSGLDPSVSPFSGENRFINDYLATEVFEQLPQHLQDFLLRTSIVSRLNASLCEALTDDPESYIYLDEIEERNLFVSRLDANHQWYRYHQLFAEFLMTRLHQAPNINEEALYQRAARWFADEGDAHAAIKCAVQGSNFIQAAEIVERYFGQEIVHSNVDTLRSWLALFPADIFVQRPLLACYRAFITLVLGQMQTCIEQLNGIESRLEASDTRAHAYLSAVRTIIACYQQNMVEAGRHADAAIQHLTGEDIFFYQLVHIALGDAYRAVGEWKSAIKPYKVALGINKTLMSIPAFWDVHPLSALADLRMMQGRLRDAETLRDEAIQIIQEHQQQVGYCVPYMGWVFTRWGELLYEWNRLDEARNYALEGLELAQLGGDQQHILAAYVLMGKILLAESDIIKSEEQLQNVKSLVRSTEIPAWQHQADRFQVQLWLAKGDLISARHWMDETSFELDADHTYYFESARLAMSNVLMVSPTPQDLERAIILLERIYNKSEAAGRNLVRIEALALLALAYQKKRETLQALIYLEEALTLAEPEGYRRLFLDLGLSMAQLMMEATTRNIDSTYIHSLIRDFQSELDVNAVQNLIEPLSERELEILNLVVAGLKNGEIANQLFLSVSTVKKHLSNIYGKLGVGNRTRATARARELGLLQK